MTRINRSREEWQAFADEWIHTPGDRGRYVRHLKERFGESVLDGIRYLLTLVQLIEA
jgi:hypothetical protein